MKQLLTVTFFLFVTALVNGQQRHAVSLFVAPSFEDPAIPENTTAYGIQYKYNFKGKEHVQANFSFVDGVNTSIGVGYLYSIPLLTDRLFFMVGGELAIDFYKRETAYVNKKQYLFIAHGGFDYNIPQTSLGAFAVYTPKFSFSQSEFVELAIVQMGVRFRF